MRCVSPDPPHDPRTTAIRLCQTLHRAGHVAYLAGGCVRDALLGLSPKDYDVATDATPQRVRELWPRSRYVGEAFGVVLVYDGHHEHRVEVECATFRSDAEYRDGRRPETVTFTDARHDAQRRDFTINGLFIEPPHDTNPHETHQAELFAPSRVIDYVQGQQDLRDKRIRAIGDASQRFGEDYLRMLRAVRFAARLDFEIEAHTADAIRQHAPLIRKIARERIGDEVRRTLTGPRPGVAATWLRDLQLDSGIFETTIHAGKAEPLHAASPTTDYATRVALWTQHLEPCPAVKSLKACLSLTNDEARDLNATLHAFEQRDHVLAGRVALQKRWLSQPRAAQALLYWAAAGIDLQGIQDTQEIQKRLAHDGIGLAPPPLVTGYELIRAGLRPGPDFKARLDAAYDAQLEGEVTTAIHALDFALAAPPP